MISEIYSEKLKSKFIVGSDIFKNGDISSCFFNSDTVLIFYPGSIKDNHISMMKEYLGENKNRIFFEEIEDGENGKSVKNLNKIYEIMERVEIRRDSIIIAVGGGTVSDLVGYGASTYLRGIRYGIIPTTLLNQCDASIGGKCGINFNKNKNRIGNFYQPEWVISDIKFLSTLPEYEFSAGMAEVYKSGLLSSKRIFNKILKYIEKKDEKFLLEIIKETIKFKLKIVEGDIRDLNGSRAILNLGHTLGHVLETISENKFSHGECVASGIIFSIFISNKLVNREELFDKSVKFFQSLSLLKSLKIIPENITKIIDMMRGDKKNHSDMIKYITLKKIGVASIDEYSSQFLTEKIKEFSRFIPVIFDKGI